MRFAILALCLTAPIALAAPVKADLKGEREKLEKLWKDLESTDVVVRMRATFELIEHPKTAEFLDKKVRALKVSKEQVVSWMVELNSEDPKVYAHAYEELSYFSPRLSLTSLEQVELATTQAAKWAVLDFNSPEPLERDGSLAGFQLNLRVDKPGTEDCAIIGEFINPLAPNATRSTCLFDKYTSISAPPAWHRMALAAVALEKIGSPTAFKILERLATGNPMGLPTRIANAMLEPGPPAPVNWKQFERTWKEMPYDQPVALAKRLLTIAEVPQLGTLLMSRLPAIKAEEKQIRKWLADLSHEDRHVYCPAYYALRYAHPTLKVPLEEQLELGDSDQFKNLLLAIHWGFDTPPAEQFGAIESLTYDGKTLMLTNRNGSGMGTSPQPIDKMSPTPWTRARLAIISLERNASDEAVVVLKQLSDGHPGILPTKEAKTALKKLGK